jgi:hypothetical protein
VYRGPRGNAGNQAGVYHNAGCLTCSLVYCPALPFLVLDLFTGLLFVRASEACGLSLQTLQTISAVGYAPMMQSVAGLSKSLFADDGGSRCDDGGSRCALHRRHWQSRWLKF